MAAPSHKTLKDLKGKWKLNKSLSDDITPILAIQGTNILLQKAISSASVTLTISQPEAEKYNIKQTATSASIPGTTEEYILDYEWRENHDPFFGHVNGRSKWITMEDARKDYSGFEGGWEQGDGNLILAEGGKSDDSWTATRIWGFEEVGGERRYTQRVKVWNKNGDEVKVKMVYDFVGGGA